MRSQLRRFLDGLAKCSIRAAVFMYPPYELRRYGAVPATQEDGVSVPTFGGKRWAKADVQQSHLAAAEMIYRGELDRKRTIEDKASSFLAGASLSAGLLAALPTVLTEKNSAPPCGKYLTLAVFAIAVLYLAASAVYAVRVRAAGAYFLANSASLQALSITGKDFSSRWAMQLVDLAQRNQSVLIRKTNELYVAEQMFLRGLISAIIAGLLLAFLAIRYPAQREPLGMPVEVKLATPVACEGLVKYQETISALSLQVAGQGAALVDLRAQLNAKSKDDSQARANVSGKTRRTSKNAATDPQPQPAEQGCRALPTGGRGESPSATGVEPSSQN